VAPPTFGCAKGVIEMLAIAGYKELRKPGCSSSQALQNSSLEYRNVAAARETGGGFALSKSRKEDRPL
jgi:hypothetical protein